LVHDVSESCGGLIISPEELAHIRAACRQRAAELEAATSAESRLSSEQEAERFVPAVPEMPANVRRFFQAEEPVVSRRQSESAQDQFEREARAKK
jgi:hypothetical protein